MSGIVLAAPRLKPFLLRENDKEQLDKYACPRCDYILREAVQTSCGHWLCNGCAEELFKKKGETSYCPRPDCGEELMNEDGRPFFPDRFVRKEINRFAIMCPNRKFGCSWDGKISELFEHLKTCDHGKQECPHCNGAFSPIEYQSHVDSCPKAIVSCPLKDHGCKEGSEMSREECLNHLTSKQGIYNHMLMIATVLSFSVTSSTSTSSVELDGNLVKSDSGQHTAKWRSASPSRRRADADGPNGPDDFGFLPDYVQGAIGGGYGGDEMGSNKLMSLMMSKITGIQAEMTKKESMIHTLQDKVAHLESTLSSKQNENEDRDFRLSLMENSNFDGSMVWKIPQISKEAGLVRLTDGKSSSDSETLEYDYYLVGGLLYAMESGIDSKTIVIYIQALENKLALLEKNVNSNFGSTMVWKIPQFSQHMDNARTGKYTSIFSLPFYSSRYGYKMCLRLYILGDGIGKGTHMSLFFVVMKGEFDNILQWPFTHKVTFKLINQCGSRDIMDIFQPDPHSSSFQKPKFDMNVASGCPRFVSMNELIQGDFIVDDTIFIKVKVDVPTE